MTGTGSQPTRGKQHRTLPWAWPRPPLGPLLDAQGKPGVNLRPLPKSTTSRAELEISQNLLPARAPHPFLYWLASPLTPVFQS